MIYKIVFTVQSLIQIKETNNVGGNVLEGKLKNQPKILIGTGQNTNRIPILYSLDSVQNLAVKKYVYIIYSL